jgi:hypothetical protein
LFKNTFKWNVFLSADCINYGFARAAGARGLPALGAARRLALARGGRAQPLSTSTARRLAPSASPGLQLRETNRQTQSGQPRSPAHSILTARDPQRASSASLGQGKEGLSSTKPGRVEAGLSFNVTCFFLGSLKELSERSHPRVGPTKYGPFTHQAATESARRPSRKATPTASRPGLYWARWATSTGRVCPATVAGVGVPDLLVPPRALPTRKWGNAHALRTQLPPARVTDPRTRRSRWPSTPDTHAADRPGTLC